MHAAILFFDFLPHPWPLDMTSNDPKTPTTNRRQPSGSSTTIPQPNFFGHSIPSFPNMAALTSTPGSKGIVANQTASTREEIDPYLNEDLAASRVYLPFETFLQKVFNLPEDWKTNVEFSTLLGALEADKDYEQKLDAYFAACDAPGLEDTLYAPAASAYNEATSVLAGATPDVGADKSSTLYVYRQDNKRVIGTRPMEKGKFCPDLNGILYQLWLQSKNDETRVNANKGPEFNFSWEQLVVFLEYKREILMDRGFGALTVLDANGLDPRDLAVLKKAIANAQSVSVTSTGATKRGSDSSKPAGKRQKSDPSKTPSRPDIQSSTQQELTFDDESIERKKVAYQCANYGLHILSVGGFKDYSVGALICSDEIQLLYYDHSCIAISAPINFRSNRRMYMLFQVCLFKTQQASLRNRGGVIGRLFVDPSPYMRNYNEYQKVVGKDLRNIFVGQAITLQDANVSFLVILGRIIDQQAGLIGRCTYIVNAESERWPGKKLVVKITWSPTGRTSEATFVKRIREEAAAHNADWVLDHIPDILHSQDFDRLPDEVGGGLAAFLNDSSTRYADGRFKYENRVLRVSVHEKLCKLSEASNVIDYARIFFDVLQVHRWIYDHARILHRDISQGNIMWHTCRGRICGVLNDFDLSSFRDSTSPSSKQRTGTRPFMAQEFHANPNAPPVHLYRHDLESLFYVMFILAITNRLLETPKYDDRVPGEKCYLELDVSSPYSKWLGFDDSKLETEKQALSKLLTLPAPADVAFELLADRVSELHTALCDGFSAQVVHQRRVRKALASTKPRRVNWANAGAQPTVRLPAVTEVELPTFDNNTLDDNWTYAAAFNAFGDIGFEVMYPVACPDT